MSIDKIREQIAIVLDLNCDEIWNEIISNFEPGPYGVTDVEFLVAIEDIWVDAPKRSFEFKRGTLSFTVQLGGSTDGVEKRIRKIVAGSGRFEFEGVNVGVTEVKINEKIDLFEEKDANLYGIAVR